MAAPLKTSLVPCLNPLLLKERLWSRSNKPLVFSTRTAPNKHFLTSRLVLSAPDSSSRRETLPPPLFFLFFVLHRVPQPNRCCPFSSRGKGEEQKGETSSFKGSFCSKVAIQTQVSQRLDDFWPKNHPKQINKHLGAAQRSGKEYSSRVAALG